MDFGASGGFQKDVLLTTWGKGLARGLAKRSVKRLAKGFIGSLLVLGILFSIGGCKHLTLTIKSMPEANRGKPVYVMVRSVNAKEFLTESYHDVANLLFTDPPDASILAYRVILPGQKQKIRMEKPEKTAVGVYCMFTEPGDQWKIILPQPLHFRYQITLEQDRIVERSLE